MPYLNLIHLPFLCTAYDTSKIQLFSLLILCFIGKTYFDKVLVKHWFQPLK